MPVYEYECQKCGKRTEKIQKITEDSFKECFEEKCIGKLKKLISRTSFVLKGGGWAADGYK